MHQIWTVSLSVLTANGLSATCVAQNRLRHVNTVWVIHNTLSPLETHMCYTKKIASCRSTPWALISLGFPATLLFDLMISAAGYKRGLSHLHTQYLRPEMGVKMMLPLPLLLLMASSEGFLMTRVDPGSVVTVNSGDSISLLCVVSAHILSHCQPNLQGVASKQVLINSYYSVSGGQRLWVLQVDQPPRAGMWLWMEESKGEYHHTRVPWCFYWEGGCCRFSC